LTIRTIAQSLLLSTAKFIAVLWLLFALSPALSLLAASEEEDGLTTQENETLAKAKDPEQKLKAYLEIASHRLKELIQSAGKQDKENTPKAVKAYQAACNGAEKCVVGALSDEKNSRKMIETLFRAMRSYNSALVSAMDKTPDDFRPEIEAAFNVSTGIQQSMSVRGDRYGIK
jgi:hypothetical protein